MNRTATEQVPKAKAPSRQGQLKRASWLRPPGLFVAVLGADGAGKSTLIETMRLTLTGEFPGVSVHHFAPQVLRRAHAPVTDPHARPPHPMPVSILKALYWATTFTVGYFALIRPALVRGNLVLFDRYLLDAIVDPRRYRYGGPRFLLRLITGVCPKPQLVILLDVPVPELQRRKQEVTDGESARQRAAYRALVEALANGRVVATGSAEQVASEACELVRAQSSHSKLVSIVDGGCAHDGNV
jgi:thymidylate kinase